MHGCFSYLKDIEESSLKVNFTEEQLNGNEIVTDVDEDPFLYIATHPILIYRLIRRFVVDLQPILSRLKYYRGLIFKFLYSFIIVPIIGILIKIKAYNTYKHLIIYYMYT